MKKQKKVVNALGLKSWDIKRDGRARNDRQISQVTLLGRINKAGWNGMADWLGNEKRPEFLPYKEAKGG